MTLDDQRRAKLATEDQPDAPDIPTVPGAAPWGHGTSRGAVEGLRVALDRRSEAIAKLREDAAALREQIGELTHERVTLTEELPKLRDELARAKGAFASLDGLSPRESPEQELVAEHAVQIEQEQEPAVQGDSDDEQAPSAERRGPFRRGKRR